MIKFTNKDKNYYVKRSLEEYDEERGLINIETSNKPFTILYKFIMIYHYLYSSYWLYITNWYYILQIKTNIVDCNDETLYLCGILVFPFILLFTAVNEFISDIKNQNNH